MNIWYNNHNSNITLTFMLFNEVVEMKIFSMSFCIIAVFMGIANLQELDISQIKIKPAEYCLGFVPLNGAGLRNSKAPPPPIRVKRKQRR